MSDYEYKRKGEESARPFSIIERAEYVLGTCIKLYTWQKQLTMHFSGESNYQIPNGKGLIYVCGFD